jgi:hypothetical protein
MIAKEGRTVALNREGSEVDQLVELLFLKPRYVLKLWRQNCCFI